MWLDLILGHIVGICYPVISKTHAQLIHSNIKFSSISVVIVTWDNRIFKHCTSLYPCPFSVLWLCGHVRALGSVCGLFFSRIMLWFDLFFLLSFVPTGSPSRGGDVAAYVFNKSQPSLPTPFYSVLVSVSVFIALSTVFHSINSPDNSPLSHSVLPVSFLPHWSFQLYISLCTFTWWGCYGLCLWHKPTELAHSFSFCATMYCVTHEQMSWTEANKRPDRFNTHMVCSEWP